MPPRTKQRVRTTVRLPRPLYDKAKNLIDQEIVTSDNINDFFVTAISAYVEMLRRKQIDDDFAGMASDEHYQSVSKQLEREFAFSDWEALEIADRKTREA
jgi:hypothetical protein